MKKILAIVFLAIIIFPGCHKDSSKLVTHNFTKKQWVGGLMGLVSSLKVHLNNYTPTKHQYNQDDNFAYENSKSSSYTLNNVTNTFDIGVTRQDPYSVYINDVNSARIQGDAHDGLAFLNISFESDGTEIIGDCVNNAACICGAPKMDLKDILTTVPLAFGISDGAVTIEAQDVSFTASVTETGPCVNNACAFLCDLLAPNKNTQMQNAIGDSMEVFLNSKSSLLAIPFNQYLKQLGVSGPIVSFIIAANGDLKVVDKE